MNNLNTTSMSIAFFLLSSIVHPQSALSSVGSSSMTQADYVIIAPARYVSTMQPLATLRQLRNGFTVAIVTTEDIYSTFGQGIPPDSAIKSFITFTLTGGWTDPKPQYFLLAGNVDAVPSHKEPGMYIPPIVNEDSVHVDQWLVEGVTDTTVLRPTVAIGRFPARDSTTLATMVTKTIYYESTDDSTWFGRTLVAADYNEEVGNLFEYAGQYIQSLLAPVWTDTITAHVRGSSPLHRTRQEFRSLWNQGAAIVSFLGLCNWMTFSRSAYFTTWDVDSLATNSPITFCTLEADQRFERTDTLSIAVALLQANEKGAVATLAPCGLVFASQQHYFLNNLFQSMRVNPNRTIGKIVLDVKRTLFDPMTPRRQTLLGDPALVVRNPLITGLIDPPDPVPMSFRLYQNYPNPFNPTTTIRLNIPQRSRVSLKVFDVLGREVATLLSGQVERGTVYLNWDAHNASSGVYFYRAEANGYVETKRMILLK